MNAVGSLLEEVDDQPPLPTATVFLQTARGDGIALMPRSSAEALLQQVTATALLNVTGDLTLGFAWQVPGAHPRRSYTVIPLAAPVWPYTPHPTAVTVELWWPADLDGRRHVRSFVVCAEAPYTAYLIACCLWSTRATGGGAEAAFLYGPDRRVAYRINAAASTCSHLPAETVARAVATTADRFGTDLLPDARTSAMQEGHIEGILTYAGTGEEATACLREHADGRSASMDAPGPHAMREAADEIERGERTPSLSRAQVHYRVIEAADSGKAGAAR